MATTLFSNILRLPLFSSFSFRHDFFHEFGGFMQNTQAEKQGREANYDNVDRRFCSNPTEKMKQKASAFYIVCYRSFLFYFLLNKVLSFFLM